MKLIQNGVVKHEDTKSVTGGFPQSGGYESWEIWLGNNKQKTSMDDVMDEFRKSSVAHSANWLLTEYNNQYNLSEF